MSDDDIYLALVDDVWKQIKSKKPITRHEVCMIVEEIRDKFIDKVETAFGDIVDDYCDSEDIYDED